MLPKFRFFCVDQMNSTTNRQPHPSIVELLITPASVQSTPRMRERSNSRMMIGADHTKRASSVWEVCKSGIVCFCVSEFWRTSHDFIPSSYQSLCRSNSRVGERVLHITYSVAEWHYHAATRSSSGDIPDESIGVSLNGNFLEDEWRWPLNKAVEALKPWTQQQHRPESFC